MHTSAGKVDYSLIRKPKSDSTQVLVIAECCIMIIGESWITPYSMCDNLSARSLGSATNTVGSHSPPHLGAGAVFYDGADQITLEEVSARSVCLSGLKDYKLGCTNIELHCRSSSSLSTSCKL